MIVFDILKFSAAVICTEAVTEIVVKSEFFLPLRGKVFKLGQTNKFFDWLHRLLDCGYCFSVWAGVLFAALFFRNIELVHTSIDWLLVGLVLHRLANLFHNTMDRVHGLDKI